MDKMLFGKLRYSWLIKVLWGSVFGAMLVGFAMFFYVARTKMPDTSDLENPKYEEATVVYDQKGLELDRYFRKNRSWVNFVDLSPHLIDALIATEDHRFFEHSGIDMRGTGRAVAFLGTRGGASTITQQLAKQFFTSERSGNTIKRIWQKMKEWVIAVEFERRFTKEEILAMFLNKFDFLYNANGVNAAAQVYFGKEQSELSQEEAAVLIGMLKNPYIYNPKTKSENATNRRNVVLRQMAKRDFISLDQYKELRAKSIDVSRFNPGQNYNGLAPHFMSELKKHVRTILNENGITKSGGDDYDLDVDGLRIYTTINAQYQRHAEAAAKEHMRTIQKHFFESWKGKDPWTYDADKKEQASRNAKLSATVENTDRYERLRRAFLEDITQKILSEIDNSRLWNADIRRLYRAEADKNYLAELLKNEQINTQQKEVYDRVLSSSQWPLVKEQWSRLEKAVQRDFSQPYKMKLYSYDGVIERMLSPIDSIKYMSMFLQIGSLAIEPQTGFVRAWVGGSDFQKWKYDHVTSHRQIGSTFKPFIYTTAVMNGYSPCFPVDDIQYTISPGEGDFAIHQSYSPKNTRGSFSNQPVTLKEGLKQSLNSVSIWIIKQLGSVKEVISLAEDMGIEKGRIPAYPSIALGSPTLSVYEMTSAYTTFVNKGITNRPQVIERIEDKHGRVLFNGQVSQKRVLPENVSYVMIEMLKYVTSHLSNQLKSDFGGKTGTTNDHVDGWFMGITPNLVVGTWVGGENSWIRFRSLDLGQGAVMARPFFMSFIKRLEDDKSSGYDYHLRFAIPENIGIELDCETYALPSKNDLEEFDDEW